MLGKNRDRFHPTEGPAFKVPEGLVRRCGWGADEPLGVGGVVGAGGREKGKGIRVKRLTISKTRRVRPTQADFSI